MKQFADLHIHSTLKPFSFHIANPNDVRSSIWYQDKPKPRERDNDIVRYTESDFTTLAQSGVKLAFVALYPLEQGWVKSFSTNFIVDEIIHLYTGFPIERINLAQDESYNYFIELTKEFTFLKKEIKQSQKIIIDGKERSITAKMPCSKQEFEQFLSEEDTIIVIPTIEGANSLISGNATNIADFNLQETLKNIQIVKSWPTRPFFITLAHHFFNGICGHSKSIFYKNKLEEIVERILLRQAEGIDSEITHKGKQVIMSLLEMGDNSDKSKRILIDIKHMNVRSRNAFYKIILQHNEANPSDKIPLIASHSAYSGIKTFEQLKAQEALDNKFFTESEDYFNNAKINLCDEDIKIINFTEGLIGINLDERILSSKKVLDFAKSQFNYKQTEEMKTFWAEHITRQITTMVDIVLKDENVKNKNNVWNLFSIGSDFDGMINPIDAVITTYDYEELEKYLAIALNNNAIFKHNNFEQSAEEIARKIMFENANNFLQKHFFTN